MTDQPMASSQSRRIEGGFGEPEYIINTRCFHLSLNLNLIFLLSVCVGKFYCKQHYGYRLTGMAQRKRPAPITAPPHSAQVLRSLTHLSHQAWMTAFYNFFFLNICVISTHMKLHNSPWGSECNTVLWIPWDTWFNHQLITRFYRFVRIYNIIKKWNWGLLVYGDSFIRS